MAPVVSQVSFQNMEEIVMYCVKCGKEIEDNVRYCSNCGHKVGTPVNRTTISLPKDEIKGIYDSVKNRGTEFVGKGSKRNIGSFIYMLIAVALCCMPWFHIPRCGSYAPLEWYEFISSASNYYGVKIYEKATMIPGICIWINMPLAAYVINMICIWKKGKGMPALNIVGLTFSVLTFIYAYAFFNYYNGYILYGKSECSMSLAFYIMVLIVFFDAVRSAEYNSKH